MAETPEEKVTGFLNTFLDFLYAAVFAFLVQQAYEKVILATSDPQLSKTLDVPFLTREEKITRLFLVAGVLYFLMTDYIQARLLISRNPFRRFRRFFISFFIAVCYFGAAIEVMRADIFFLYYIVLILCFGSLWAHTALNEYPESGDKREMLVIRLVQPIMAFIGFAGYKYWSYRIGDIISIQGALFLLALGWVYEFIYVVLGPTQLGIEGGSGILFVSWERVARIRNFFKKIRGL